MNAMPVTSNVIADLWPLYASGEASDDTRALVDAYLSAHPEVRAMMPTDLNLPGERPAMPPDAEAAAFSRTRDHVYGRGWIRGVRLIALALTVFAIGRMVSDTSFDVSPVPFIADTVLAIVCWTVYVLALRRYRAKSLRRG